MASSAAVIHWLAGKSRVLERRLHEVETRYDAEKRDVLNETKTGQPDLAQIMAAIQEVAVDFGSVKSMMSKFEFELEEVRRLAVSGGCVGHDTNRVQQTVEKENEWNEEQFETENVDGECQTNEEGLKTGTERTESQIAQFETAVCGHEQHTTEEDERNKEQFETEKDENELNDELSEFHYSEPLSVAEDDSGYEDDLDEETDDKTKGCTTESDSLRAMNEAVKHRHETDEDEFNDWATRAKLVDAVYEEFGEPFSHEEIDVLIVKLFIEPGDELMTKQEKDLELLTFIRNHPGRCRDWYEEVYNEDYDEHG